MKRILIIHSNMEIGGAESSLLGLLQSLDYSSCEVDLMLLEQTGELMQLLPSQVKLVHPPKQYESLVLPIKKALVNYHSIGIIGARLLGKLRGRTADDRTYSTKQYAHWYALSFLPKIQKKYDIAISFNDPHFIVSRKVDADVKLGWLHTDFSRIHPDVELDARMWGELNGIVHISYTCKEKFDERYPQYTDKSIVVENILSKQFIELRSQETSEMSEMNQNGTTKILSVGRFCEAKNFDSVPEICKLIRERGLNVTWYLIGYGGDEALIRQKIHEHGMEDRVIVLGKKSNPYPYIKACDVYVQPSRYEGKCVAVREAQMLGKPVIITNYATAASQLEDGVDGVIVPMDNKSCAQGIADVLCDPKLMEKLTETCKQRDYSNSQEVEKLYQLMKG